MFFSSRFRIFLVVFCYFLVSIALVFVNKFLLSGASLTIPAPLFITWVQCTLTCAIIKALGEIGRFAPSDSFLKEFPPVSYSFSTGRAIAPLSLVFVLMIVLNNLCLTYVEVSFYNVARSLTIVINVVFSFYFLGERTSFPTLACLVLVILGFVVGSEGEVNFSLLGTVFGVLSSVFVSLNAIFTKKMMAAVDGDKWKLQYFTNANATLMFLPAILMSGEYKVILAYQHLLFSWSYWGLMSIAGVLGFLIGIVTVLQITLTSPLTHNISGTAKSCVQTLLALAIWRNPITFNGGVGIFLVIAGSALYAYVRNNENQKEEKSPEPQDEAVQKQALLGESNNEIELSAVVEDSNRADFAGAITIAIDENLGREVSVAAAAQSFPGPLSINGTSSKQ